MKYIIVTAILFCSISTLKAQTKKQQISYLENERDSLMRTLNQERALSSIEKQQCQEKLLSQEYIVVKLKKESETLRAIMKSYIHTIDSLNTLNVELMEKQKKK
ncbi:MAG TPA: hypothetical protein VK177_20205 [Flavobacteriales bacterium]|nr:hypothetical protein [Flavobacteriales bacterium]